MIKIPSGNAAGGGNDYTNIRLGKLSRMLGKKLAPFVLLRCCQMRPKRWSLKKCDPLSQA
jgi:hypothetical protein